VVPLRKTLKVRTIFNLLGPLVNPLPITGQVMGVFAREIVPTVAEALQQLGRQEAIVLHGREKLDEVGLADATDLAVVSQGQIRQVELHAEAVGVTPAQLTELKGGEVADNAEILRSVLQGKGTVPQRDAVAVNTALALNVGQVITQTDDPIADYRRGVMLAQEILASGAAWQKVEELIRFLA
jgi:anthranilate phosphoribosyltransferase